MDQVQELCQLLRDNMDADPQGHKIIVFFTTARLTQFYAELCNFMVGWFGGGRGGRISSVVALIILYCVELE